VAADEARVTALCAAAWCAVAIGRLILDWRF